MTEPNRLIQYIKSKYPLSAELEIQIRKQFVFHDVKKRTILLPENRVCRKLYFLVKGTVRTFYNDDGKDVSSWFYQQDQFFTAWYSFLRQQPGFESIEIIENAEFFAIDYSDLQAIYKQFPRFNQFGRLIMEEQLAFIDYFSKGYMFLSAKERYQLLLSFFPDIEQRVKLGHIASFLGISQETLSRIRSN